MGITDRISAKNVLLNLDTTSKRQLLQILATEASQRLERPHAEILAALQEREALGSTALGRGVALPHARLPGDGPPLMLFARLRRPIDFDARDEEAVDLAILVLWPKNSPEGFLPALSEICRALREPRALRQLRLAGSGDEVVALLDHYGHPGSDPSGGE